jgi:hypothetical protein
MKQESWRGQYFRTGRTGGEWSVGGSGSRGSGWRQRSVWQKHFASGPSVGEMPDVVLHREMPKRMEVKTVYFRQCLLRSPVFEGHAVRRDEDAPAIPAEPAVYNNRLLRKLCHCAENSAICLSGGFNQPSSGISKKLHSQAFCRFFSFSLSLRCSPRRPMMVVTPSFCSDCRPLSFGCAPR